MSDIECLQCGERKSAIVASQKTLDQIFCAGVNYFGEVEWEAKRHRFRDWSDKELIEYWDVKPEHVDKYRRIMSGYEIASDHRNKINIETNRRLEPCSQPKLPSI